MKFVRRVYNFVFFPFRLLRSFFHDMQKDPAILFIVMILIILSVLGARIFLISPLEMCKATFKYEESFCSNTLAKCYLHENDKTDHVVIQNYVKCQSRMPVSTCNSIFFDCEKLK